MLMGTQLVGFAAGGAVSTQQTSGSANTHSSGFSSTTWVNRTFSLTPDNYIRTIGVDLNTAATITIKIVKRVGAGTYDVVYSQSGVSHGGGGFQDLVLSSPYTVPNDGGTYYLAYYVPASDPSVGYQTATARSSKSGDVTGTGTTGWTEDSNGAPVMRAN